MNMELESLYSLVPSVNANDPNFYVFTRKHPYYCKLLPLWCKATRAYNGGRAYIENTLQKHPSETDEEFNDRKQYSYNINLIKYSTRKFGDYIFSKPPRRENVNADIADDFDRKSKSVNSVMREVFDYHTIYGLAWVFIDNPALNYNLVDLKTKQRDKIRPYAEALAPMDIPDWDYDSDGSLSWVIRQETVIEKNNPKRKPVVKLRRTLYTKEYWQTFDYIIDNGDDPTPVDLIIASDPHVNTLGIVPAIPYSSVMFNRYFNVPEIDDILTIHDSVLKGESELLTNILKQTYGQLVLPSTLQSTIVRIRMKLQQENPTMDINDPAVEKIIAQEASLVLSRTKHIPEDAEERGISRYIQPNGANIESIIQHDDRLINTLIKMYGFLIGVDTTQRSSAESKSADNISLAAQLSGIASRLQELENKVWKFMNLFDPSIKIPKVLYNTNYDIHELKSVIAAIVEFANLDAGNEYQKQIKITALDTLDTIRHVPDEVYEKIKKEIDANTQAVAPMTFDSKAKHKTDASGSTPDGIRSRSDYDKSRTASISKGENL